MPYVQKGVNLTLTILIELIRKRQFAGKSHVYIQWDGASENVAKTNLRFFIWLLLLAEHYDLPLLTITACRCRHAYHNYVVALVCTCVHKQTNFH